jgi:hypothetical protein
MCKSIWFVVAKIRKCKDRCIQNAAVVTTADSDMTPPQSVFSEDKLVTLRECDYRKHAEHIVQKFEIKPYTEIKG